PRATTRALRPAWTTSRAGTAGATTPGNASRRASRGWGPAARGEPIKETTTTSPDSERLPREFEGGAPLNNKESHMTRVAILDDYQGVARRMADWTSLPAGTDVVVFADHLSDTYAVAKRLADFDAVVAMRERTPFSRGLLERLPRLTLLL